MSLAKTIDFIQNEKFIYAIRSGSEKNALKAADAAISGGVKIISVALNVPDSLKIIKNLSARKDVFVGACSIFYEPDVKKVVKAGAKYISCPINYLNLIPLCRKLKVASMIGGFSPTEIVNASREGADFVKIYPISDEGGQRFVEDLMAVIPGLNLVVAGGVTEKNCVNFLNIGANVLSVSRGIASKQMIDEAKWSDLEMNANKITKKVKDWNNKNGYEHLEIPFGK